MQITRQARNAKQRWRAIDDEFDNEDDVEGNEVEEGVAADNKGEEKAHSE